jgi:putative ABC transport system permease protein
VYLYYTSGTPQGMTLVVHSREPVGAIAALVRRAIAMVDPDQSIADVKTMDQLLNGSISARRFATTVVGIFGLLALLLTIVGLYSVVAYNVAQRSREIAVRMALGAMRSNMIGMVLGEALTTTMTGILAGTAIALLGSRFATAFIYGVPARDPKTFSVIALLLLSVTALAAYIPARHAASLDPQVVLRSE